MPTLQLLSSAEHIAEVAAKVYAVGGEIVSITAILWALNFVASLTEKTYRCGKAVGTFYFDHLHTTTIWSLHKGYAIAKWLAIRLAAVLILGTALAIERSIHLWNNRASVVTQLNTLRNNIGDLFIYRSPLLVTNN